MFYFFFTIFNNIIYIIFKKKKKRTWKGLPRGKIWGIFTKQGVVEEKPKRLDSCLFRGWQIIIEKDGEEIITNNPSLSK